MDIKNHWERVYKTQPSEKLGWYEPRLRTSLNWINELKLGSDVKVVDVGGGASTLVDDLLELGYKSITVLDISEEALSSAKKRLGGKAQLVKWLIGDITIFDLPKYGFEVWHDRAVFHFLTTTYEQQKYLNNLTKALIPGGQLIIGTFSSEAPPKCSGLPVQRYSVEQLENTLGAKFKLKRDHKELHITPGGVEQLYLYCHFRKVT